MFFGKTSQSYKKLLPHAADDHDPEVLTPNEAQTKRRRMWYTIFGVLLIILSLLIPIVVLHRAHRPSWTSCGDNPTTARERGCSFDLISFAWQMPECYDPSLVDEFAALEDWTFWTDEHGNATVPQEVAFLGERTLYVTWHYHIVHCTFVWRQLHRAYEAGWIDSDLRAYEHTVHCQKMILMDGVEVDEGRFFLLPNDTVVTGANVIYPSCEKIHKASRSSWWDWERKG